MTNVKRIIFFMSIFFPVTLFAAAYDSPLLRALKGIEFSAAGGPTWATVDDTSIVISNSETDNVIPTRVSKSAMWKVGIGYHFLTEKLQHRKFFNDLLVEFNVYRNAETVKGDVWRYQSPIFNNYRFTAPITSTRAMLDIKPGLFTVYHVTVYPILGVGAALTDVSYSEAIVSSGADPSSYHSLGTHTNWDVSYDLGVGFSVDITDHLGASLEYLYTYLIDITPADESTSNAVLLSPPKFTVNNQTMLLGLSWKI